MLEVEVLAELSRTLSELALLEDWFSLDEASPDDKLLLEDVR